ncbi:hypothetical protein CTI12_AA304820 [Artemisia annua]|uniref:Uncharacterized protein n=1 Tax=Artemisia annua TaxID=35608 RepID=A0A2U1N566_ARTAN|nr:hypothetical protein CTI12_AA304820 [Artemisia annua]
MITDPKDAMPWVGLYVAGASLTCTLAMAADAFQGFRHWKLWFPNKFFALNTVSITLIAIAMKLPVDLTTSTTKTRAGLLRNEGDWEAKWVSIAFLVTMLANFLPSLGLMNDKELLVNMVAWSILLITITVNVAIQISAGFLDPTFFLLLSFPILCVFSVAFTVPASRRILEHRYKELHGLASYPQEIKFSYEELEHNVKKYWMMAETGNPQFAIACSEVASAFGFIGLFLCYISLVVLSGSYPAQYSDYNWSLKVIVGIQSVGVFVGSIAPAFRCFAAINCFELSKKWSVNHLNIFKVGEHWTQRLQFWKRSHVRSHIPGRHCKIVFHITKNLILNICIALQIMVVIFSDHNLLLLVFLQVVKKVLQKGSKCIQQQYDAKLSERISRNALKAINKLLSKSEKNEPGNLIKLLKKSIGFKGVLEFHNDQVPPLHSEETKNSWSLVVVTLTAIVVALSNTADDHGEGLIASMREGLRIVRDIEKCLNANSDLVKTRKAARRVWTQIEVYRKWLQIDLQKKAHEGKTSKEILEWLRDEAVKIVIQLKSGKRRRMDDSHYMFIVASSMYRVSQTILIHCSELENWPIDGQLLEWISNMIADILCACFTNLPCVIKMMCHHDEIEKREDIVRSAAQLLGRSKKILKILNTRQLPNIDVDSMAYIGNWHALPKSEIPNGAPLNPIQLAFPSPNESVIVNIGV